MLEEVNLTCNNSLSHSPAASKSGGGWKNDRVSSKRAGEIVPAGKRTTWNGERSMGIMSVTSSNTTVIRKWPPCLNLPSMYCTRSLSQ